MSAPPPVRRTDKAMPDEHARDVGARLLRRFATVGADGYPYCVPLLYLMMDGKLYVHGPNVKGHLRSNVEHEPRICFEIDEPGEVFPYGRFECELHPGLSQRRAVRAHRGGRRPRGQAPLLRGADGEIWQRGMGPAQGLFPAHDLIAVYEIAIERITGKETALPAEKRSAGPPWT